MVRIHLPPVVSPCKPAPPWWSHRQARPLRGRVSRAVEAGADAHIDSLAKKYLGKETYPFRQPGEVRIMYEIEPESVSGMG